MERILGIDLGTTNSEISVLENGKPQIIPVDGESLMPSCIAVDQSGKLIVGRAAKNMSISHPESTILSIKRKMGSEEKVAVAGKEYSPEEISSFILLELKKHAEKHLGETVKKAVITVPAYFDDSQRKATKNAGILAGLDVVRIINEPTAAAVAYEAGHKENHVMLVYDLGGGTFDVSLVVVEDGVVEVKASHGDVQLGGDDFDQLLIDHVANDFKEKHGIDLNKDIKSRRRLMASMEKAKRSLSDQPFCNVREEFIHEDLHLDMELSRQDYEEMIKPLLQKTLDCIHQCLKDAEILTKNIDRVILVGGSSRTPLIHQLITSEIGLEPHYEIDPDLIVSMGAAIQGGVIAGMETNSILVDVTPYTFGTEVLERENFLSNDLHFFPIIKRNTPLPTSKGEVFQTSYDGQEKVEINIYQGEEKYALDNILVGNFLFEGLRDVPAGNEILFNLDLDLNGILNVTVTEKATGLTKNAVMDPKNAKQEIDIEEARRNIASLIGEEDEGEVFPSEGSEKGALITKAKGLRKRAEGLLESLTEDDAEEMRELLNASKHAVMEQQWRKLAEVNESLEDMIFYLEE